MNRNGESRVLQVLSKFQPKIIMDIGANEGEWCRLASETFPDSTIHAFEIVPETYEKLLCSTQGIDSIVHNNFGLSDQEGHITINIGASSEIATAFKIEGMQNHNDSYTKTVNCKTRKACDYLKERRIESIDFVKIDTEGMDYRVLKGFELHIKKIRAVQFEYGIFNISSHDLLADFYKLLTDNGFAVGKIFPRKVVFFEYHFHMENFHGSNFIAVKKEDFELIKKLETYSL